MEKYYFLLFFVLFSSNLQASRPGKVDIKTILKDADIVALVTIQSGKIISNKNHYCGAKYTAKIDNVIKDSIGLKQKNITLGNSSFHKIGGRYLVFLKKDKSRTDYLASTNSASIQHKIKMKKICSTVNPEFKIMHSGFAMFEDTLTKDTEYNSSILIYSNLVGIPKSVKTYDAKNLSCDDFKGCLWAEKDSLINSLKNGEQ